MRFFSIIFNYTFVENNNNAGTGVYFYLEKAMSEMGTGN